MKSKKLVFLADLHVRESYRFEEYKEVFKNTVNEIKKINNVDRIFILGDIFHDKDSITGESFNVIYDFFKELLDISNLFLIPGNHDGYITTGRHSLKVFNKISKELNKINKNELTVMPYSEIIEYKDYIIGHFSLFDSNKFWKDKLDVKNKEKLCIALYHGIVKKARNNFDFVFTNGIDLGLFKNLGYDRGFFGDVHKFQFLDKKSKKFLYPGSLIQQNFGESLEKGFVVYDLENDKVEFKKVHNDVVFYNLIYNNYVKDYTEEIEKLPGNKVNLKIKYSIPLDYDKYNDLVSELKDVKDKEIVFIQKENCIEDEEEEIGNTDIVSNLNVSQLHVQEELLNKIYEEYYKDNNNEKQLNKILNLNKSYFEQTSEKFKDLPTDKIIWDFEKLDFERMFVYEKENFNFDFQDMGVFAPNKIGKSSLLDIIEFSVFGRSHRIGKRNLNDVVNSNSESGKSKVVLKNNNGDKIKIKRKVTIIDKENNTTNNDLTVFKKENNKWKKIGNGLYNMSPFIKKNFGSIYDAEILNFSIDDNLLEFIRENPASKIDKLSKALHLDVLDEQLYLANSNVKSAKKELNNFQNIDFKKTINDLKENINNLKKEINSLKTQKKKIEKKLNNIDKSLFNLDLDKQKNVLLENKDNIEAMNFELNKINEKLDKIKSIDLNFQNENVKFNENINNISSKILKIHKALAVLDSRINETKKIAKLSESVVCDNKNCELLNWAKKIELDNENSIIKKEELSIRLKDFEANINKLKERKDKVNKIEKINNEFEYKKKILVNDLSYKKKVVDEVKNNIEKIENSGISNIDTLKIMHNKLGEIDEKIINISTNIGSLKEKLKNIKSIYINYKKKNKEVILGEIYIDLLKKMKTKVVNIMIPRINKKVNEILDLIDINFAFNMDNTGVIYITDEKGTRDLRVACGAEKTFAGLAYRLSFILNTFLPVFNILFLDEPTSLLDRINNERFMKMVQIIKDSFGMKVVLVTNIEEFKKIVDNTMTIERDNNGFSHLIK